MKISNIIHMALADRQPGRLTGRRKAETIFLPPTETEPEEGFSFDVESELTDERLELAFSLLRQHVESEDWISFYEIASPLSILIPLERIPPDIFTDDVFAELVEALEDDDLDGRSRLLQILFSFYPDRSAEYEQFRVDHCAELKEKIAEVKDPSLFYKQAFEYLLFSPNKEEDVPCTDETFQKMRSWMSLDQGSVLEGGSAFVEEFFENVKNVSFFHPDKKALFLSDPKFASVAKEKLDSCNPEGDAGLFFEFASTLAILSADRVNIPSPGRLELIKRPKRLAVTPSLPPHQEYSH